MSAKAAQKRIQLPSLPSEIWVVILQYATLTSLLDLDFLLRVGAWRPTARVQSRMLNKSFKTKKSIIRVCKAWRDIGTPLLWEIVRVTNANVDLLASQLLHSEQAPTGDPASCFGWWTKHLYIEDVELQDDQTLARAISCFPNLLILTLPTSCSDIAALDPTARRPKYSRCIEAVCQSCPALAFVDWEILEYESEMLRCDWYHVHTKARNLRAIRFLDRPLIQPQVDLPPTITTVVCGMGMRTEAISGSSLRDCQHFIVDFTYSPQTWLPLLHSLGKTITTFTLPVEGWYLQDALSAITESCPNFKKLVISFESWADFRSDCCFPPTMNTLDIRSDKLQGRDEYYQHLIAALGSMTAVGLQTVQLIDSRNCDDMRQHSSTMRLARTQLIEKKWNLVDDKGRLFLDERQSRRR